MARLFMSAKRIGFLGLGQDWTVGIGGSGLGLGLNKNTLLILCLV